MPEKIDSPSQKNNSFEELEIGNKIIPEEKKGHDELDDDRSLVVCIDNDELDILRKSIRALKINELKESVNELIGKVSQKFADESNIR